MVPSDLYARLCHAFLVSSELNALCLVAATANWVMCDPDESFAGAE